MTIVVLADSSEDFLVRSAKMSYVRDTLISHTDPGPQYKHGWLHFH